MAESTTVGVRVVLEYKAVQPANNDNPTEKEVQVKFVGPGVDIRLPADRGLAETLFEDANRVNIIKLRTPGDLEVHPGERMNVYPDTAFLRQVDFAPLPGKIRNSMYARRIEVLNSKGDVELVYDSD